MNRFAGDFASGSQENLFSLYKTAHAKMDETQNGAGSWFADSSSSSQSSSWNKSSWNTSTSSSFDSSSSSGQQSATTSPTTSGWFGSSGSFDPVHYLFKRQLPESKSELFRCLVLDKID